MTWSLLLDNTRKDIVIANGTFTLVTGFDEIRQRIEITLQHFFGEYFLNILDGTPWYESILGQSADAGTINTLLRNRVLSVPGVVRIDRLVASFDGTTREYSVTMTGVELQVGAETTVLPNETFTIPAEAV